MGGASHKLLLALVIQWVFWLWSIGSSVVGSKHTVVLLVAVTQCCAVSCRQRILLSPLAAHPSLQLHSLGSGVASSGQTVVWLAHLSQWCVQLLSQRGASCSHHTVLLLAHLTHQTAVLTSSITRWFCHLPSRSGAVSSYHRAVFPPPVT